MINLPKIVRLSYLTTGLFLGGLFQDAFAALPSFADTCSGVSGNVTSNVTISSVFVIGGSSQRQVYLVDGNGSTVATKHYSSDLPTDTLMLNTAVKASILGNKVDLCISKSGQELLGINFKQS